LFTYFYLFILSQNQREIEVLRRKIEKIEFLKLR
jgi:hypothetical protein